MVSPGLERLENWLWDEIGDKPEIYFDSDAFQKFANKAVDDANEERLKKGWGIIPKDKHVLTANKGDANLRYWRETLQDSTGFDLDDASSSVMNDIGSMSFEKVVNIKPEDINKLIFKRGGFSEADADALSEVATKKSFVMKRDLKQQIENIKDAISKRALSIVDFDKISKKVVDSLDESDDNLFSSVSPSIKKAVIENKLIHAAGVKKSDAVSLPELRDSIKKNTENIMDKYEDRKEAEVVEERTLAEMNKEVERAIKVNNALNVLGELTRPKIYKEKVRVAEEQGKSITRIAGGFKSAQTKRNKKIRKALEDWF